MQKLANGQFKAYRVARRRQVGYRLASRTVRSDSRSVSVIARGVEGARGMWFGISLVVIVGSARVLLRACLLVSERLIADTLL